MLINLVKKGLVDSVLCSDNSYKKITDSDEVMGIPNFDNDNNYTGHIDYSVMKDNYQVLLSVDDDGIYKAEFGQVNISSGGSVAAGTTLVTKDAFESGEGSTPEEQGKFTINNDASVMFTEEIEGELSFVVKSGKHAKVNIFKNMTLTNEGVKRSAIDIEAGGILDLWVAEGAEVTVNSGLGEDAVGRTAGKGGYAGIHVPEGATLTLKGAGTIKAIGGDASDGSIARGNERGGGTGGGGAGAGIGGNGGNGGAGSGNNKQDGFAGENCGIINIYNNLTVYAYGGGGGSGASSLESLSGGGAGGYPAAGIGRRWCWRRMWNWLLLWWRWIFRRFI